MKKFVACVAAVLLCGSAVIAAELKSGLEVGDSVVPGVMPALPMPSPPSREAVLLHVGLLT